MRVRPESALLALTLVLSCPALPGQSDREGVLPTDWLGLRGASVAMIQAERAKGYRIVTLSHYLNTANGPTFDVTFVANKGEYYRAGATWYYGTPAFIGSKLSGRRITDLEPYTSSGNLMFAAAMVSNTGSQAKAWSWYYGTPTFIASKLAGRRITDLDAYYDSTLKTYFYSALMIANTGDDYRDWWWYTDLKGIDVVGRQLLHKAQILDVEKYDYGSSDRHCVVYAKHPTRPMPGHFWVERKYWPDMETFMLTKRCRPVTFQSQGFDRGGTLYEALMMENYARVDVHGASCIGSNRKRPRHTNVSTPLRRASCQLRLLDGPANAPVLCMVGGPMPSRSGKPGHLLLDFLGATGCSLSVNSFVSVGLRTGSTGAASLSVVVPGVDLGTTAYTQFLCVDRGANPAGFTTTNALRWMVGQ